jgi:hypothetical protein
MSVTRLLSEMDSYELSQWQTYLTTAEAERQAQQTRAEQDAKLTRG